MSKKITLIIAVAMILVAASSAYGYSKEWGAAFFDSGTITCNDTTYTYWGSSCVVESYIYAWTYNVNVDSITGANLDTYLATFRYIDDPDTSYLNLELVDYGSYKKLLGWKETDTTGEKEGGGTWTGHCSAKSFYVTGTWSTGTGLDDYYFDYDEDPPVGSGPWAIAWSSPPGVIGDGIWGMIRESYTP